VRDIEQYKQIITNYNIQGGALYFTGSTFRSHDKDAIVIDSTLEISQCEEILTTLSQQPKINCLHISLLNNENFYEALQQALPKLSNITNILFATPPFPIMQSLYQLLSQLKNHPTLTRLEISNCFGDNQQSSKSVFQALASQTFPCLRELCVRDFHKQDIDVLSLPTILNKNDLFALKIRTFSSRSTKTESFFSLNNLIKILPKTHLMNLSLNEVPIKEFQELIRILPFTYIHTLNISTSIVVADPDSLSSQITQNTHLMHDYSKNCHPIHFEFDDIFLTPTSGLLNVTRRFLYTKTGLSIFKCYTPSSKLNKFIQSLKTIITNIKNSPIYSEYKSANTIPNLWLIFNPALFKRLFILLKHKYDDYLTLPETQLIQDNRSILSKLTPPSPSQFVKLLGYKPSDNSPKPPLSNLPNDTWMRFIVPHCMEIDPHQLLSPFSVPTKTTGNSTSR
jgi:hypothetical protein